MMIKTTSFPITMMSGRRHLAAALAGIAGGGLGCAEADLDQRDLGNTSPTLSALADATSAGERAPVVLDDGFIDGFIEGHWVGRAEDLFAPPGPDGARPRYAFPSGSLDFTLDISLAEPTIPSGQIIFGSGSVPAPERAVVYPPEFERPAFITGTRELPLSPREGFVYPLYEHIWRGSADTGVAAGALALSYQSNAVYADWCTLQLPRPTGDGRFDCLAVSDPGDPNALCATLAADGAEERYDCDLASLCGASNICQCTATACVAMDGELNHMWLIRDGDDLLGTLVGAMFDHGSPGRFLPVGTIRFERVDP